MIVPLEWLKEYIDLEEDAATIADHFTSIGYMLDRPIVRSSNTDVLDLEVRQNRSDCLSLVGLARDLGAYLNRPIRMPDTHEIVDNTPGNVTIDIPDTSLCYRFAAMHIEEVSSVPSPSWMQQRLEAYGVKVINAIVDITNYVAIEFGLPMHAFDAAKISDTALTIRSAAEGETITLFGGREVTLTPDDIIIADTSGPISFGGLMGGEEKSVTASTTSIILEAAVYNQASVRRSSIRHAIRTESSTRLEKFQHTTAVDRALARAAHLICTHVGGAIVAYADNAPAPTPIRHVSLHISNVHQTTGVSLPADTVRETLTRLEIVHEQIGHDTLKCTIPYFRTDIEHEADIIEEVIRMYGYDKIPEQMLSAAPPAPLPSDALSHDDTVRDTLTALGYDEYITEPITYEQTPERKPIILENSLNTERTMLRTSLVHSLLKVKDMHARYGIDHGMIFEVGKVYYEQEHMYIEERTACLLTWNEKDFFALKGDVAFVCEILGFPYLEHCVTYTHVDSSTWAATICLDALYKYSERHNRSLLSTPPSILRHDFSFIVHKDVNVEEIRHTIQQLDPLIARVSLGEPPLLRDDTHKSLFLRVTYQRSGDSLSEAEVKPIREKIFALIQEKYA